MASHTLTSRAGIAENFPHLTQATCDTPIWQACLIASTARKLSSRTCIFILNSPDVRAKRDITEAEVRVACERAKLPGLKCVTRQTHSVFVAHFKSHDDAQRARQKARLNLTLPSEASGQVARLCVKPESHWLEVNSVFVFETDTRSIKHETVSRRVFDALEGPLVSSFRLLRQEINGKRGAGERTRYILRPSDSVSPVFVERFYIPLDAAHGDGKVWGIFKPVNRHWKCPACHKKVSSW